jgi:hypothetical protein
VLHLGPDAGLGQRRHGVVRGRTVGAVEAVERPPVGRGPGERVAATQLDHDPPPGMPGERGGEAGQVGHVVEHVVADDHVGVRDVS